MNILVIGLIYVFFVCSAILAGMMTIQEKLNFEKDGDVLILTDKNFKFAIQENQFIMVEFYAPWCGHCKQLEPQYQKAAETLKSSGIKAALGKVDSTVEKFTASQFSISGYPTLKFFINGKPMEYKGGRTSNDIISWIERKTGPPSLEVNTSTDLEDAIKDNDVVLAYFGDSVKDKEYSVFQQVALTHDHIKFVHSFDSATRESVQGTFKNVKLFKNFDEKTNEFGNSTPFTVDKLNKFLEDYSYPLVFPWGDVAASKIQSDKKIGVLLFRESYDTTSLQVLFEVAKQRKLKEGIQFAQVDKLSKEFSKISEQIGSTGIDLPAVFIIDSTNNASYLLENEALSVKSLDRFLNNFKSNRLVKYIKSLPIPPASSEAVQTVVRKNYDQVVRSSSKDFLIMYFATWCGHCTQFKPKFEELAQRFSQNTNLGFAKIDGVNNLVEDVAIEGYPTLYFFKNGQKSSPVKYEGNRDSEDLIQFIKKHTTYTWIDPIDPNSH